jgi:hypothetical protein
MNRAELGDDYFLFGGKGDVWNGTAHIYKSGAGNLCGRPALSTNWVQEEDVQEAGCPVCIEKYKKMKLEQLLGAAFYN